MNLDIHIIQKHLSSPALARDIRLFGAVASTNSAWRDLAMKAAPEGTVVIADEQTAGHRRFGKPWFSPVRLKRRRRRVQSWRSAS
jgi:BirA family transcriptional regulator, biotin operon repressor / biotin---[acetyl-CoA-carboxylase] ligase